MNDELKPCPFCGGDAFLHESAEFWYVSCNHCINQTTHFYNGKGIVIDRWNTRVDDAKLKLAVEALESERDYHWHQARYDGDDFSGTTQWEHQLKCDKINNALKQIGE